MHLVLIAAAGLAAGGDAARLEGPARDPASKLEGLEVMAVAREAEGDSAGALDAARRALALLTPRHWKWEPALGQVLRLAEAAGQLGALEADWQSRPGDPAALRALAAAAAQRGDSDARLAHLRAAAALDPNDANLWAAIGASARAAGQPGEAVGALQRAAGLARSDTAIATQLAEAMAVAGDERGAERVLRGAFPRAHERIPVLRGLGLAAGLEGALREAGASLDLAAFLLDQGRGEEAEETLRRAAEREHALWLPAARLARDHGRLVFAQTCAEQARRVPADTREATLLLADVLEARGESSVAMLKRAVADAPDEEALDRRLFEAIERQAPDPSLRHFEARALAVALAKSGAKADLVRAARWAAWTGQPELAAEWLARAGRDFDRLRARYLERAGDFAGALEALAAARTATNAAEIDRESARIEKARGNPEAALATLTALARDRPRDPELAREVAMTLQAAGNVFEALEWWKRAHALAPPEIAPEFLQPILDCYERLGQPRQALDFLAAAAPKLPPGHATRDWARQAAVFAKARGLSDEWLSRATARGGATEPAATLPDDELALAAAEASQDWDRAVDLARSLAARKPREPDAQTALPRLLERAGRLDDAGNAWRRVAETFPRSAGVLRGAAEFFQRAGDLDEAAAWWEAAGKLAPMPPTASLLVARQALKAGDREKAQSSLEDLLRRVPPQPAETRLPPPPRLGIVPGRLPVGTDPATCRLLGLWELGRLLANAQDAGSRLAKLAGGSNVCEAWAAAGAGLVGRAAERASPLADAHPVDFAVLAIEGNRTDLIEDWLADAGPDGWQKVSTAFQTLIAANWSPNGQAQRAFSQRAPAFLRWVLAEAWADAGRFRLAAAVEVPAALPDARRRAFALAGWRLAIRDLPGAMRALDQVLDAPTNRPSLLEPFAAAFRARWLLATPEDRSSIERRLEEHNPAAHLPGRVLAAALRDDRAGFEQHAEDWITKAPAAVDWFAEAAQLDSWYLGWAARGLLRQLGKHKMLSNNSLTTRILRSKLEDSEGEQVSFLAREYHASGGLDLAEIGAKAASIGRTDFARRVYEVIFQADITAPEAWTRLLSLDAVGGYSEAPLQALTPNLLSTLPPSVVAQAIRNAISAGRLDDAGAAIEAMPDDPTKRTLMARLLAKQGRSGEAAAALATVPVGADNAAEICALYAELGVPAPPEALAAAPPAQRVVASDDIPAALAAFEAENPNTAERAKVARWLIDHQPDAVRHLPQADFDGLFALDRLDGSLRVSLATLRNQQHQLERELEARWLRGDPTAREPLLELALSDHTKLQRRLEQFLSSGDVDRKTLERWARLLMANNASKPACTVFARLDEDGFADFGLPLAYAEALHKTGQPTENILAAIKASAAIDPAIRIPLAAYYFSIGNPAAAQNQLENLPTALREKAAALQALSIKTGHAHP